MLSDESSSDSETGRFKSSRLKKPDEQIKSSHDRGIQSRSTGIGRSRPSENDQFRREFDRKRDERNRYERRSRERPRSSRHSPARRRRSRERSSNRSREHERHRHIEESRRRSKPRDHRGGSRDKQRRSRSQKSPELKKDEIEQKVKHEVRKEEANDSPKEKRSEKFNRRQRESHDKSSSPDYFIGKRSEIHKPLPVEPQKKKSDSPIIVEEHVSDASEEVQPGSYYSLIPAVVKEKSEESSEIDSSDDERLRAKLLNLEKELQKTRKKKHKKKHKRKSSKSSKERDREPSTVEVSSTTDIDKTDIPNPQSETVEVTSTEKTNPKESSEEGEILSDDDLEDQFEIDPTDLRHKLKRPAPKLDSTESKRDLCGPSLPPHLESKRSVSRDIEGPALPPHLTGRSKNIGPSIPDDMRKVLAATDREVINYESSDEDVGIGPLPTGTEDKWSDAHQRLEERALDMKIRKLEGHSLQSTKSKSREQWMLELPEAKAKYLGLEARSFRAKEGPDMSDRSTWTDTPEEKARKTAGLAEEVDAVEALRREARARHITRRDEDQERAVKKHKKKNKREESLLDIHQKKQKKKKKQKDEKEEAKKERRTFSRDVDLQVNRFDEAQKKSIIKKAQELNTRFSSGEAKFL